MGPDGAYWVLTAAAQQQIHKVSAAGRLLRSTALALAGPARPHAIPLVWDAQARRLVVIAPATYEIHTFDEEGEFLGRKASPAAAFKPTDDRRGDEVLEAAALPDRRLVAQVSRVRWTQPDVYANSAHLDVLGHDLRLDLTDISVSKGGPFGLLEGSDSEGNLYFTGVKAGTVSVRKARLVPVEAPPAGTPAD